MKIVINVAYGGFDVPEEFAIRYSEEYHYNNDLMRVDTDLIQWIEEHNGEYRPRHGTRLIIKEIPNDSTDWIVEEYDGLESILYVVNGKIKRL